MHSVLQNRLDGLDTRQVQVGGQRRLHSITSATDVSRLNAQNSGNHTEFICLLKFFQFEYSIQNIVSLCRTIRIKFCFRQLAVIIVVMILINSLRVTKSLIIKIGLFGQFHCI